MRQRIAQTSISLFAALCLTACSAKPQLVRVQTVEIPTPVYVSIPPELTQDTQSPAIPIPGCAIDGQPVFCIFQAISALDDSRAALNSCNADKHQIRALQH